MKNCRICGDQFNAKDKLSCSKCTVETQANKDPVEVCLAHAERFPERRDHYLQRAELMLVEVLRQSNEPQEEIKRRMRVSDFRQGIKYCRSRAGGRGKPSRIYRCPKCGAALVSRSCLSCEMEIKGLLK